MRLTQFRQRITHSAFLARLASAASSLAFLGVIASQAIAGDKTTVCTITVNSPEEKEVFQRNLPEDKYQFVELVEAGRHDWLAASCRKGVQCDVLLISGHFDAGTEFYTDRLEQRESLAVEEMERVACSDSCPGLFSQLKEVYLFGCNTLNGDAGESTAAEIARTLIRSGLPRGEAEQLSAGLDQRYGESNRDTMRRIFSHVPVIYGFSSLAPLGPYAGGVLAKYFQAAPLAEIGSGMPSASLLTHFAPTSMIAVGGLKDLETRAPGRSQFCEFVDERTTIAAKVELVHRLLGRDMGESRMLFERVEKVTQSLTADVRNTSDVAAAIDAVAANQSVREQYLAYTRNTDRPEVRARMIKVAAALGWLNPSEERAELVRAIAEQVAFDTVTVADVDLACSLNRDGSLDIPQWRALLPKSRLQRPANAGVLACLGSNDARIRVLQALTSTDADDVHVAQVYLRHHPLTATAELRGVTRNIARMPAADAQVRALETLAQHRLSDRETLDQLTRLFMLARSLPVQRAIAGVLIRADYALMSRPDVARVLRQYRLKSPDGVDLIDVLIRRLLA